MKILQLLFLPTSILLTIKLIEMCICVLVTVRNRKFASALISLFGSRDKTELDESEIDTIRRETGFPSDEEWPVKRVLARKMGRPGRLTLKIYRYRWLVPAQLAAVLISTNYRLLSFQTGLLMATIFIGLLSLLVYRLTFGYADTTYRKTLNLPINTQASPAHTRQERVQHFFAIFIAMVVIVIAGYAVIYDGVDRLAGAGGAFQNIPRDWSRSFHLLYFSIVTFATVGYGDIIPHYESLFARLTTASEIIAGFMLLGLLVTSVSLTFERD